MWDMEGGRGRVRPAGLIPGLLPPHPSVFLDFRLPRVHVNKVLLLEGNTQLQLPFASSSKTQISTPHNCILSPGWKPHPQDPSPVVLLHAGGQHATAQLEGGLGGLGLGGPAWGLTGTVGLWPLVQLSLGREERAGSVTTSGLRKAPI